MVGERRAVSEGTRMNGQMAGGHKLNRSINNISIVAILAARRGARLARRHRCGAVHAFFVRCVLVSAASSGGRTVGGNSGMQHAKLSLDEGADPTKRQELLVPRAQQVRSDVQGAARGARRGTTARQ